MLRSLNALLHGLCVLVTLVLRQFEIDDRKKNAKSKLAWQCRPRFLRRESISGPPSTALQRGNLVGDAHFILVGFVAPKCTSSLRVVQLVVVGVPSRLGGRVRRGRPQTQV